ncbi:MAG: hypothetical protein RJA63_302 [Pseudomonadota bacterium]|jgi:hypothetical protein|nr:hypothetical protein [Uliginosibacterium sp.]
MSSASSSSSSHSSGASEVTLSGTHCRASVNGDSIEIRAGEVFVNGVSHGPVPAGAEVRYRVSAEGGRLTVEGALRGLPSGQPASGR